MREAAKKIWLSHSETLRETLPFLDDWIEWTVALHDFGKGTAAFQKYIPNPEKYRGDKREKAHTPLSALAALKTGEVNDWGLATNTLRG